MKRKPKKESVKITSTLLNRVRAIAARKLRAVATQTDVCLEIGVKQEEKTNG
jgi:hypothetical protein